jgi:hypothetical protein
VSATLWYVPAYRAENGNVIPCGVQTVIREHAAADAALLQKQWQAADTASPDVFLASRVLSDWQLVEDGVQAHGRATVGDASAKFQVGEFVWIRNGGKVYRVWKTHAPHLGRDYWLYSVEPAKSKHPNGAMRRPSRSGLFCAEDLTGVVE